MSNYNGWKNWQTWNIALWINNDEGLYSMFRNSRDYRDFVLRLKDIGIIETPDGAFYADAQLDIDALDAMKDEE